jgi:4-diphosphocytidyl-2-C-methyl-D-erythritol kinase
MSKGLRLCAPAKVNLTLEVLSRRPDGYHEVATVMQTIGLCDMVTVEPASEITVEVSGPAAAGVPAQPERDLAYRAAKRLAFWLKEPRGARICLEKHVPAGMGLGGGSSDAAAVLRGLNLLWGLDRDAASLARSAAELGSDVPFFVYGGTALCRGRGEIVDGLVDAVETVLTLFLPPKTIEDKTAAMYAALDKSDFSAGVATRGLVDDVVMRRPVLDGRNVFDRRADVFGEEVAAAMEACRLAGFEVHFAGSGPAFYALRPRADLPEREAALMDYLGFQVRECRFLSRAEALAVEPF